ncbi:CYTH domain-containing protein [Paracoccus sp. Z330]|uniref:CYTH domain-containing protein n=1 Tax=Paracoccus onchidii TaxID=3017813 RepID=A0ABT4ZIX0_9RHOB|nr:CYTH domain-containing protein [Paracoccus onchidii]MDB6179309.1 CYTH domain-containing protein [Paracoccus onchidii]
MPKEIERKFLLVNDSWREHVSQAVNLRDGLIAFEGGRKVRIRFYNERATLTVKGPRQGITRDEFEYEIPHSDGLAMLDAHCPSGVMEKTRYHVPYGGFEWIVDEYRGILDGIILAEVELPSEDIDFPKPPWAGQEVTGQPEYRQINMLRKRQEALAQAS